MAEGFLGRWAQRKADARQGKPLVEPEPPRAASPTPQPQPQPLAQNPLAATGLPASPAQGPAATVSAAPEAGAVPLTLQDAQALDKNSDFKPFVARDVDPAVRNAAMKKLFSDPHYNVMDRLDIYIDDYSQPDPLPLSMLRQMASAQFLKLVDEEVETPASAAPLPGAVAQPESQAVPEAAAAEPATAKTTTTTITRDDHAHLDLQLQPDHATGAPGTGRGAE